MDTIQASVVADALLQASRSQHTSMSRQGLRHSWSRSEWSVTLLFGLLCTAIGVAVALVFHIQWRVVVVFVTFPFPFGMLVGSLVVACHRVLTRRSSERRARAAASGMVGMLLPTKN